MPRKEKIIDIAAKFYLPPVKSMKDVVKMDQWCEDLANAILALPLEVPSEEEIEEWVNKDKKSLIDYEVYTMSELKERLIGRFEAAKWAINEILKRNGNGNNRKI